MKKITFFSRGYFVLDEGILMRDADCFQYFFSGDGKSTDLDIVLYDVISGKHFA
ncbi:MAG: hypothetical protein ACUZ8H_03470 [Candidatus Anammoxibacter sp.]